MTDRIDATVARQRLIPSHLVWPFALITSLFFAWGLASNMTDTLLAAFKKILSLTDLRTALIQNAYFGAYFVFALPAAFFIRRFTYKTGIIVGLLLYIIGAFLFLPAANSLTFAPFLVALFILAGGVTFLETAANPYILELGSPETATRRLNLAQSFNPIGSVTGIVLSEIFILSKLNAAGEAERAAMSADELTAIQTGELNAVMGPYVGIAIVLVLIAALIAFTKMPRARDTDALPEPGVFGRLLSNRGYVASVFAQFAYVAAQVCVWSFTIRYVMAEVGGDEASAAVYLRYSLILFLVSRFVCTWLMGRMSPQRLFTVLAAIALALTLMAVFVGGGVGVYALVATSACMSLMFPTIFSWGVEGLGTDTKIGAAGLVMAIVGGALVPMAQGAISDASGAAFSYIVPAICFAALVVYGLRRRSTFAV